MKTLKSIINRGDFKLQNLNQEQFWIWAIFVAGFVGLLVSGFLWYEYSQPAPISGCAITGGCESVRVSDYSTFMGISLPILGVVYYLGLLVMVISKLLPRPQFKFENVLLVLYTFSGFLFSLYLTYLELFVIHAICQWCVVSAIAATLGFGFSLGLAKLQGFITE